MLLIGDSVSKGYTRVVRQELAGAANVHRSPANGGSTTIGRRNLGYRWPDDTNFNAPAGDGGHQNVPPSAYERNLRELVGRLGCTGANLIFATTPPVSADLEALLKAKQVSVPWKPDTEWHELVLLTEGDELRLSLDGKVVARHRSAGFAHPLKRWFSFLVPSTVWIDDVKIWKVK